jgi:hypothetical protein
MSPGVLSKGQMERLFQRNTIINLDNSLPAPDIDGSAFDLSMGKTAWQLTEGQRPATSQLAMLRSRSQRLEPIEGDSPGHGHADAAVSRELACSDTALSDVLRRKGDTGI